MHSRLLQAFICARRVSSQAPLSPGLKALSRHCFSSFSAAVRHSEQGLCAYTGEPRNKSENNANTGLAFITGPPVISAEEIFPTHCEMFPDSFPFPLRVGLAFTNAPRRNQRIRSLGTLEPLVDPGCVAPDSAQRHFLGNCSMRRSRKSGVWYTQRMPACTVQSTPKKVSLPTTPTPDPTNTFHWLGN